MKLQRLLPWLLTLLLQGRAALSSLAFFGSVALPQVIHLCPWAGAALVLAGTADALSGASATITGLVPYSGNTPVGEPTNVITGFVGMTFKARITVLNPGSDHGNDLFDCQPVPPGLTIDTNAGAKGYILGTPTRAGSYPVTLYAGNTKFTGGLISLPATLVIDPDPNEPPPTIVAGPQPQVVADGGTAVLDVTVSGDALINFQWWKGDLPVMGGMLAALPFPQVRLMDAGLYRVVVSNRGGSVTSAPAELIVEPFSAPLRLVQSAASGQTFSFTVQGPQVGRYVLWNSLDAQNWFPIATQRVVNGTWNFATSSRVPVGFFRATASP